MLARLSPGLSATVQRLADPVIVRAVPFFRTAAERFIGSASACRSCSCSCTRRAS